MAEPYERATLTLEAVAAACTLCGDPTVGTVTDVPEEDAWPREYPCCPACAYGVADAELQQLLRATALGPN